MKVGDLIKLRASYYIVRSTKIKSDGSVVPTSIYSYNMTTKRASDYTISDFSGGWDGLPWIIVEPFKEKTKQEKIIDKMKYLDDKFKKNQLGKSSDLSLNEKLKNAIERMATPTGSIIVGSSPTYVWTNNYEEVRG